MTDLPPPGWYADPDPSAPGRQRWWDGARWSAQTQDAAASVPPAAQAVAPESPHPEPVPAAVLEPEPAPATAPAPAWSNPWHQPGGDPEASRDPSSEFAAASSAMPMSVGSERWVSRRTERETRVVHLPETSRAAWILGGSPFLTLALYAGLCFGIGIPVDPTLFLVLPAVVVVVMAFVDSAGMRRAGYAHPPTGFLVLLSPIVYLIVRTVITRQYTKGGAGPLILFLVTAAICAYPYIVVGQIALDEMAVTSSVL